jgi:hypothetical protein
VVQIRGGLVDGACVALSLAAALAVYWIAEGHIAGAASLSSFPLDDSWIHLHFARNLAEGAGFAYNPGVPVSGSTAPLWTLLLAGAFSLAGIAPAWAKALGIAAALATALLTRRLVWMWTESRALALAGGVIAAVAGPLVWGALSGMEVSLAALLVTGAIVPPHGGARCADRPPPRPRGSHPAREPAARPARLAGPADHTGRTAIFAGIVGALLSPWVAFNLATAGTPLPATASAKVEGGLIGVLSGSRDSLAAALVQRPWQFEMEWIRWLFSVDALLPVLLLPGLWGLWRMRGRAAGFPRSCSSCTRSGWRCSRPIAGRGSRRAAIPFICCRSPSRWRWPGSRRSVRGGSCAPRSRGAARRRALDASLRRDALRVGGAEHRGDAGAARTVDRRQYATRIQSRPQ